MIKLSENVSDWSTWKAHAKIAEETGSSDRRGRKRKANLADLEYEALNEIPDDRVPLNAYLARFTTEELMVLIRRIAPTRVTDDIRISKCWAAIQLHLYRLAVSSHLTNGAAADDRKKETLWKELVTSSGNFLYHLEQ